VSLTRAHLAARGFRALSAAALLVLPAAGTVSRERGFCRPWLALTPPEKVEVLGAEDRPGLRETLDAECRNWPALMDFEVRAIVDRKTLPAVK
jgi:hypothetical protein